ncbi:MULTISPECIES: hypothetical protein [unclassified Yoonia]|uniref:hypothetical protein n=1 Tax=unclassified Yoonia TaxID=2629118 RepID=UPI002B001C48|nr:MULTISPECIES: hypothetical protein [unclassified Yoonia]
MLRPYAEGMAEIMTTGQATAPADRRNTFSHSAHSPHLDQPCGFGAAFCVRGMIRMRLVPAVL